MKKMIFTVCFVSFFAVVFASQQPRPNKEPVFPEGDFRQWVMKHMQYPELLKINKIARVVTVDFWVDGNGEVVKDIFNIHDGSMSLGVNEVIKAIKKSPSWLPARKKITKFTLKIDFNDLFDSVEREGVMTVDKYSVGGVGLEKWLRKNYSLPSGLSGSVTKDKIKFICTLDENGLLTDVQPVEYKNRELAEDMAATLVRANLKGWPAKADGEKAACKVVRTVDYPFTSNGYRGKSIENSASFRGADIKAFHNWAVQNITMSYGDPAGSVIAWFVVEKDGSVGQIRVVQTHDYKLARDVINTLERSPKWEPATTKDGEKVPMNFRIPVNFGLK